MRMSLCVLMAGVVAALSGAAFGEQLDNPAYAAWAKYKPGTTVTLKQTMDMPGMANMPNSTGTKIETAVTEKLSEVNPDAVVLEVTTKTIIMGRGHENTTKHTVPAKVEKGQESVPVGVPVDSKLEVKDMKEGKETVELKGKKIETVTREFTATLAPLAGPGRGAALGAPAHFKVWNAAQVPGGLIKLEQTSSAEGMAGMKVTKEVTDYNVAK